MFARAVTWNSIVTIFQTASVAGPTLAGVLIAVGGSGVHGVRRQRGVHFRLALAVIHR